MNCPKCNSKCDKDEVGIICGPWRCAFCDWLEEELFPENESLNNIFKENKNDQDGSGSKDNETI